MTEHSRGLARRLVAVARGGEPDPGGEYLSLEVLAVPEQRARLRAVLGELVGATASMMLHRATARPLPDRAFALDLRDDAGEPVDVDRLDPPVRGLVRALLAELNGRPQDTGFQLDLAVLDDLRFDPVDVLELALLWTAGSLQWCEEHDAPTPAWLS
ncbi:hypothetical protein [Actinokineospora sp.]|uniref:hypothetical protein n=1 Tax=Actinokineospora sp. TaxID=1872133 RepID=UPI004037D1A3